MPFEIIPHTADWAMRVRAADHVQLFVEAARGMNAMTGLVLADSPRVEQSLSLSAADAESLLVAFLSELVYYAEHENLAFDLLDLRIDLGKDGTCQLSGTLSGAAILSMDKAIKAVTYHNLQIRKVEAGLEVEIVFDV
jgi:SHS2 domain-containing protein